MKQKTKDVFYCDHCTKHTLSKHSMATHEEFCGHNPKNTFACSGCQFVQEVDDIYYQDMEVQLRYKYFKCTKLDQRMHPLKAVKKKLIEKYPEQFEDSILFPTSCEHREFLT